MEKNNWSIDTVDFIAWGPFSKAMKHVTASTRGTIKRFQHRWLPTGARLELVNKEHGLCTLCNCTANQEHLLTCPHESAVKHRTTWIRSLSKMLRDKKTEPTLQEVLEHHLNKRMGLPYRQCPTPLPHLLNTQQKQIGWNKLHEGYLSGDLIHHQNDFLSTIKTQLTGTAWATAFLAKCWEGVNTFWKFHCQQRHGQAVETPMSRRRDMLMPLVRARLAEISTIPESLRQRVTETEEILSQRYPSAIVSWLERTKRLVEAGKLENARVLKSNHKSIDSYFQRI